MANITPEQFAAALLKRLGIHQTPGAVQAVTGWERAEGGNWHNQARFNPLNTTQNMPGAGNTGSQGNIKVYKNWDQGIDATARTLRNGRYGGILSALQAGDPRAVASAIDKSPWGTHGPLVHNAISGTPRVAGVHAPGLGGGPSQPSQPQQQTTTTPGVDNSDARRQALASFLLGSGTPDPTTGLPSSGTGDILDFALQMKSLKDVPGQATTSQAPTTAPRGSSGAAGGSGAHAALSWAESKLGQHESGGPNQGGLAGYLNQRFGMSGQPWCAMFTSAAVTKGGAPSSARTASVAQVRQKAMSGVGYHRGFIPGGQAKPGDLILFGNAHIGMVKANTGGHITYVGGNQSDAVTTGQVPAGGATVVRPKYGAR